MYRLIFILFLLLNSHISYSKSTDTITPYKSRNVSADSVIELLKKKNQVIESQNEIMGTAINAHSSIFSGLSTYFAVISILLTIMFVALPLINYFFVLKPSKKAMKKMATLEKELLSKIEQNFENYLLKIEHKKAKELISALKDGPEAITDFVNFFLLRSYSDFDAEDQEIVISFLEKKYETDVINLIPLHQVLRSRPSRSCEAFYKKVIETGDKQNYEYALQYLVDNKPEENMAFFELIILNSPDGHKMLSRIIKLIEDDYIGNPLSNLKVSETRKIGEEKIKLFLNNQKISDSVEGKESAHRQTKINFISFPQNQFIKETYYYKKYHNKD